jgi:hypothetical protein
LTARITNMDLIEPIASMTVGLRRW